MKYQEGGRGEVPQATVIKIARAIIILKPAFLSLSLSFTSSSLSGWPGGGSFILPLPRARASGIIYRGRRRRRISSCPWTGLPPEEWEWEGG